LTGVGRAGNKGESGTGWVYGVHVEGVRRQGYFRDGVLGWAAVDGLYEEKESESKD